MTTSFLRKLREANLQRVPFFGHTLYSWNPLEWAGALVGEAGEVANIAKKMRRRQDGCDANAPPLSVLREQLGYELADVLIYADLLAAREGIDLEVAVKKKFELVSQRVGFPPIFEMPT